jgi:putative transposase
VPVPHGLFNKKAWEVPSPLPHDLCLQIPEKLLVPYGEEVKQHFEEIASHSDCSFEALEVDQDHMHCLVKGEPRMAPLAIVRRLKQESTVRLWQKHEKALRRQFWKERTFWSDGYFCCTIGNASQEAIRQYIANQG